MPMHANRVLEIARTFALGIFLLASGCGQPGTTGEKTEVPVPQASLVTNAIAEMSAEHWLGSESCRECHSSQFESYQHHPMAHSFASISSAQRLEDYSQTTFRTDPALEYFVTSDSDQKVLHHEKRSTDKGETIYDDAVPIDFAVGSCAHGRSYLSNVDGRFYQSPITWYSRDSRWDLSPGYPKDFHERFDRRVTHACVICHAGRPIPHSTDPDRFGEKPFGEMTIGCERCHGPGQEHVKLHRAGTVAPGSDPIINPAGFSSERLDAVCNQCHLAGDKRVLKSGHTEFDFQPGMLLTDLWTVFVKQDALDDGAVGAVSHVEQMYSSGCYTGSNRKMTCVSCHDAHSVPAKEEKHKYYRDKCIQCHSSGKSECSESATVRDQLPEKDSCIVCHMPQFSANNVHSAQTDHRILKRRGTPKDDGEQTGQDPSVRKPVQLIVFQEPGATPDERELVRARGIYLAERAYMGGEAESAKEAIKLLTQVSEQFSGDVEVQLALGRAYIQDGQPDNAIASLKQAQKLSPNHEDVLQTMASLYHEIGKLRLARSAYEELLRVNPTRSRYYGRYTHVLGQLGETREGIKAAKKALQLNPSLVQTHQWLMDAYNQNNDAEAARMHRDIVRKFKESGLQP